MVTIVYGHKFPNPQKNIVEVISNNFDFMAINKQTIVVQNVGQENDRHKKTPITMGDSHYMEQMRGIEPPYQPWQGCVLPLNYICMAVQKGLEPSISSVTGRHVNHYTTGPYFSTVKVMAE